MNVRNALPIAALMSLVLVVLPLSAQEYEVAIQEATMAKGLTVYPPVLYPGRNVVTVRYNAGITGIEPGKAPATMTQRVITLPTKDGMSAIVVRPGQVQNFMPRNTANNQLVEWTTPKIEACQNETTFEVFVNSPTSFVNLPVTLVNCEGDTVGFSMNLNTTWRLDEVRMPVAHQGETVAGTFRISVSGLGMQDVILDSISSTDPNVSFDLNQDFPMKINGVYQYKAYYAASEPGVYRFPVITWLRRQFPNGGEMSYPVADTGVIFVRKGMIEVEQEADMNMAAGQATETIEVQPAATTVPTEPTALPGVTAEPEAQPAKNEETTELPGLD